MLNYNLNNCKIIRLFNYLFILFFDDLGFFLVIFNLILGYLIWKDKFKIIILFYVVKMILSKVYFIFVILLSVIFI